MIKVVLFYVAILGINLSFGQVQESTSDKETCDKEREEYLKCGSGCAKTCDNLNKEIFCPAVCVEGCFCISGYFRNSDGKCIPEDQCTQVQESTSDKETCDKEHEEYLKCGSGCAKTCENLNEEIFCPAVCVEGCFCVSGYFRNSNGECVPEDQCTQVETFPKNICPENERYDSCAEIRDCMTCELPYPCPTFVCAGQGCECETGYLRNSLGTCIKEKNCSDSNNKLCPTNEIYSSCAQSREYGTCINPNKCENCKCIEGCECKQGYYRNVLGTCVPEKNCNDEKCEKPNQEYLYCGSGCPKTCDNRDVPIACSPMCVSGCFCKMGYIMGNKGDCVKEDQCNQV